MTLGGQSNYTVAPMRLEVIEVFKGSASKGMQLDVLMGHGIAANGDSENGNMTNAEGRFWLRLVDGQLGFAGQRFSRAEPGGFRKAHTSNPSDGVLSRERILQLERSCPIELDGGTWDGEDSGEDAGFVPDAGPVDAGR